MPRPAPFEEPAKTDLRDRCEIAVDQAGYELVETPKSIPYPEDIELNGSIRGDVQSLDASGVRTCYYVRPQRSTSLPKWLANIARASHSVTAVRFYLVVNDSTIELERACRESGAGLLSINLDNAFEVVVDYDAVQPRSRDAAFEDREAEVRRRLETRVNLKRTELELRFSKLAELTNGMPAHVADKYTQEVERMHSLWTDWGDDIGRKLDAAFATKDPDELEAISLEVEHGPNDAADEDE